MLMKLTELSVIYLAVLKVLFLSQFFEKHWRISIRIKVIIITYSSLLYYNDAPHSYKFNEKVKMKEELSK
jgi:hypothetical protein